VVTDGPLRIATRGSRLALWQAEHVKAALASAAPGLDVEIVVVRTTGDTVTDGPLSAMPERGIFTREIDRALLDHEADLAVHSLKDLPTEAHPDLVLAAVLEREDPRDALVVAPGLPHDLQELPAGARIGTGSLRRRALLGVLRPVLEVQELRGNLDTRLGRVARGELDAAVLALAGIRRLGREADVAQVLAPPTWLPAPGQGAIAVVARTNDSHASLAARLDHPPTRACVTAERTLLRTLEGGCQVPLGALAEQRDGRLSLIAFVATPDGARMLRGGDTGAPTDADAVGRRLARRLQDAGAAEILEQARA
jgi:hydroxymethylbilane synthase